MSNVNELPHPQTPEKKVYPQKESKKFNDEKNRYKFELNIKWAKGGFNQNSIKEDIKTQRKIIESNLHYLDTSGYSEESDEITSDRAKLRVLWELENIDI